MPTTVGKKLRSRKVKLACERRQIELADSTSAHQGHSNANKAARFDLNSNSGSKNNPKLTVTESSMLNNSTNPGGNESIPLKDLNGNGSGNHEILSYLVSSKGG